MSAELTRVGIVGAGTMGAGIAQVAAGAGCEVVLYDIAPEIVERGLERIRAGYDRMVARARLTAEGREAALGRIAVVTTLDALATAEIVIEAAPEDATIKRQLFAELERVCTPDAILASNTSSLSITGIAGGLARPGRGVGMHFFNPAPVLPLVEVIGGAATDPATVDTVVALATRWGKTPVRAGDTPGFIVNRIARAFGGEALRIAAEGTATPAEIDRIVRAAGFRMGPFELSDLVGLDVGLAVSRALYEQTFGEPRYRPHPMQARMVAAGHLGRKTGQGFYRYEGGERVADDAVIPFAEVAPLGRPASILIAGQGAAADELALALQGAGQSVSTYSTEESTALVNAGIPRARRLRDVLLTTTVAIEATLGPRELKRAYWFELDEMLPPQIPLLALALGHGATELGSWSARPERVIGLGLAGPFASAPLVELARGERTGEAALTRAVAFLRAVGKEVAVVGDPPGQVLIRILSGLINEAAFALDDRIASAADIDTALKLGLNYPAGPIEWSERLGLDRVVTTLDGLHTYYGEERYRVAPRLRRALLAGYARLG
ncbi:MAG: 3-hydroxybutyryl-CoA dehydrogenase; 3-hydroxyacyl-CoA dehydrogenase [uncultured Thermomicrobiales bacterium]|uniref:3-hydroxybutyryl-CoA dehydrogenase 3-hydroxyacyl-CoA dehydrogenase n=1 Tax=uncultured Thermomicrobiales bacterium TaxID=1645740 RepID=A0A6J4VGL1_9BACT|nr:MAG: 3-hydroxybutyryl-CoA dehydrogenase; 3-hydroxyacyl-CoA dehydrogenase [uncultured Thermomicrobiales bacterium]